MRSIQRRFEIFKKRNGDLGDYINFAKAIKNQDFNKGMISRWFTKLVPKEDYEQKDRRKLIDHLTNLSNTAEDNRL